MPGSPHFDPNAAAYWTPDEDREGDEGAEVEATAMSKVRIVRSNAERDPNYRPYCMRCPRLRRMDRVEPFFWRCGCGAEHDEREAVPVNGGEP